MFSSLSIRARLILSFSVLLCLLLAVASVSLQRFQVLTDKTGELIDEEVRRVFLAQNANQHAQAAAIYLLKILQTPEREKRVPLYAEMDADNAASESAITELSRGVVVPAVKEEVAQILALSKTYASVFQETVELVELGGPQAAHRHFDEKTSVVLASLLSATQSLVIKHQQLTQAEVERLRGDTASARLLVILLSVGAFLTGSILAWLISRSIVTPVREAVAVAETIANGDYKREVPVGRRDEIGALLRSLAIMRDSIGSREESILRLAYVDTLTGLPNRTRLLELFEARCADCAGVLFILGIDRFAPINKALGHAVGDQLLREIAVRLKGALGESEIVARLWGDEFALLLNPADKPVIEAFAQKILMALREPMSVDGQRLDIDASIGIVSFPQDGSSITSLMRRADLAMNAAKRRHSGFAFGAELEDEPAHEQLSLIGEMREALARGEFVAWYQPKLNLAQNRISGAEALIRWRHPQKGMIPPGRFIPFAEQTGFIREITPWILRQAMEHAAQWRQSGMPVVTSVNLSTHDLLNHTLVDQIRDLINQYALPPELLCLEITESALMDEPELALKHLHELAALGLKLSIDDYGTGQASLAYVKTLPVHELKIDRAFVTGVDSDHKNAAIVRSTILLCRELGLSVVAEGAETQEEVDWLRSVDCDLVQGYRVAKPMPVTDFTVWVSDFNQAGHSASGTAST
jgi:diguanylate cyclase (GGDEF)-like protein